MIHILYCEQTGEDDTGRFKGFFNQLPYALQEKNRLFKRSHDAMNHLAGLALLQEGLILTGFNSWSWHDMKYTSHQRPYFEIGVDFNIAHSGSLVVCALSKECKVGVDVEAYRAMAIERFKSNFNEEEWKGIVDALDPQHNFFQCWTQKEAVIKAIGVGLNHPLSEINPVDHQFRWENETWFTKEIFIDPPYNIHICSNRRDVEMVIKKMDLAEMIGPL
jgi:4'-phosphopantetheinyl transferase